MKNQWTRIMVVALLGVTGLGFSGLAALAQPTLSKSFSPATIGPGSVATATFIITNGSASPVTGLAFTDTLPAGVTIATPSAASTTCPLALGGSLSAPAGGGTITLSGGTLGGSSSCQVKANVTSTTPGAHTNPAITLSSSAGSSLSEPTDLTVATDRPGFTKSFSPATLPVGSRGTLTFTIDNTANATDVSSLNFSDTFPAGLEVAEPANASTTCGGLATTLTATPGTGVVSLDIDGFASPPASAGSEAVNAGASCMVTVDVVATSSGLLGNVTGDLDVSVSGTSRNSGKASATLDATITAISLIKEFTDDPVVPGGTVALRFTVKNLDRINGATAIAFSDDLDPLGALTGLAPSGALPLSPCGVGSSLAFAAGTGVLSLTGGSLPAAGSCTFTVVLAVPAMAASGVFTNTSGAITATIDGGGVVGNMASDDLFVSFAPILTKEFTDDPVGAGSTVTLEFTITNSSADFFLDNIAFTDELTTFLPLPIMASAPTPDPPCGPGSSLDVVSLGVSGEGLELTGGSLDPDGTCTFEVTITIPDDVPTGNYLNTTSEITGDIDTCGDGCYEPVTGLPASDTLAVVAAPRLSKEFTDDPVQPGDPVTLEFTLTHDDLAPGDATSITFTDNLAAALSGLAATGLPLTDVCGTGNGTLTGSAGDTLLTFTGGSLMPGETCTFSVTLNVPAMAAPGAHTNTTSTVSAVVLGVMTTAPAATDDLKVAALTLTKTFVGDPVLPGATVDLTFVIENVSATLDATAIFFQDDLNSTLTGLAVDPGSVPATPCGAGSLVTLSAGNTFVTFSGGSLLAGEMCTFTLTLDVPIGAVDATYGNVTTGFRAIIDAEIVNFDNASDSLVVDSSLLSLTKSFTDDPATPGGTVTLEFTLTNLDPAQAATSIAFTDDLDAALTGLMATVLPVAGAACNGGTLSGSGLLTFSGGSLAGGASCTFSATLLVPAGAALGTVATNTTSGVTGTIGGLGVIGPPASDTLRIDFLTFTKSFDGPTTATGTPVLTFTITNLSSTSAVADLGFTDGLGAVISGLVATSLPATPCGAGSSLTGTSVLTLSGGNLAASGSCTFSVDLLVPGTATTGTYPNTTSELFQAGLPAAVPATADLRVEPPPTFAKAFAPDTLGVGLLSTLSFSIDNSASAVAAGSLAFTDNLPAGVVVAAVPNLTNTCGGTATAVAGSGVVSLSGGTVAAGDTCLIQVSVRATATGTHVNTTGELTSSSGNSGTASDTLTAVPQPAFTKAFSPDTVAIGATSTLTFMIDNTGSSASATALAFTDSLPAGLSVAALPNATTTCGGTVTAMAGAASVSFSGGSVAASSTCVVRVDVVADQAGSWLNTSGNLTSSLGTSAPATATLNVAGAGEIAFSKTFIENPVLPGGTVLVEYTITNLSAVVTFTAIEFMDDLDVVVTGLAATGLPVADVCGAGSQLAGTSTLALTGGNLAPGTSCTFQATLVVPATAPEGTYPSTTTILSASVGTVSRGSVRAEFEAWSARTSHIVQVAPATASLVVDYLDFSKVFSPSSVLAGETTTLTFTIVNPDPVNSASGIVFTDDLDAVFPGLVAVGLPANDVCGLGSQISGTSVLTLTGGSLGAGGTCMFSVTVQVPLSSGSGSFTNITSGLDSVVGGSAVSGDPATAAQAPINIGADIVNIPTLSTWGLILLAALLSLLALRRLRPTIR